MSPLDYLHSRPQWVAVLLVPKANGKTDKIPCSARTLASGVDAHNPANWASYEAVCALTEPLGASFTLGFVITRGDDLWCVDIDSCLQADGTWSPLAQDLVRRLPGTVVEISQSGKGLHLWGRGPIPEHRCKNTKLNIECYSHSRFIAIGTGAQGVLAESCEGIAGVVAEFFPADAPTPPGVVLDDGPCPEWRGPTDDEDLLRRALQSRSAGSVFGGKASFADLWHADENVLGKMYPPDPNSNEPFNRSSADAALAQHLAFWTGKDRGRIRALMDQSALKREKWEREDYMHRTIDGACQRQVQVLTDALPPTSPLLLSSPGGSSDIPFVDVAFHDIAQRPPTPQVWWWDGYLPAGQVALLGGHGGSGKSLLALMLAVHIACGQPFLTSATRKGQVFFFSAEDPAEVVTRRLAKICSEHSIDPSELSKNLHVADATGGDPSLFSEQRFRGNRKEELTATYEALKQRIEAKAIDVLIVDNASDVFDGDEIKRSAVRAFIRSLALLIRPRGGAVLLLAHVDKATSRSGSDAKAESYSGSTAWHNSVRARMVLLPTTQPGFVQLAHQKSQFGRTREPLELRWTDQGLLELSDPGDRRQRVEELDSADIIKVLTLIDGAAERGQFPSTSTTGRPSIRTMFERDSRFPKNRKPQEISNLMATAERQGLVTKVSGMGANRKPTSRFEVTSNGRAAIAAARSAPSVLSA